MEQRNMSDQIKAIEDGLAGIKSELEKKLDAAIVKHEGQVAENGKASEEARAEVKALAEKFEKSMTEIAQRMEKAGDSEPEANTAGEEFVASDAYKSYVAGNRDSARFEVKATITSDSTTVFPLQRPGIIQGNFTPVTLRSVIPTIRVTGNAVNHLRENAWTNAAREVTQGATKPESALTFTNKNFVIETVAHWIPVTEQLAADAPAVMDYINRRLRHGLAAKIDAQLISGDGTSPHLSGFIDSGNYTSYSLAASGDTLHDAVSKAKYAMWAATGEAPDTVVVNPADWGAEERTREGATGMYLFGGPTMDGMRVVLSTNVSAGNILVMNVEQGAVIFERQGSTIEIGRNGDDFKKNMLTIRAEERLALAVMRPSLVYYGDAEA
jgi:HK97 family phage major capsid protein